MVGPPAEPQQLQRASERAAELNRAGKTPTFVPLKGLHLLLLLVSLCPPDGQQAAELLLALSSLSGVQLNYQHKSSFLTSADLKTKPPLQLFTFKP